MSDNQRRQLKHDNITLHCRGHLCKTRQDVWFRPILYSSLGTDRFSAHVTRINEAT